jgi:predicted AAA+ superfamily ATPase
MQYSGATTGFHAIQWYNGFMFKRTLDIKSLANSKSLFLLGPRLTGKSTVLKTHCPNALVIDLLDPPQFRSLAAQPELLADRIRAHPFKEKPSIVVIDEIQKLPSLLDEVHRLIEIDRDLRFVLTGSSARKLLRKSGVNLLGGRARMARMHPITYPELKSDNNYSFEYAVQWGGLPSILTSKEPKEDLKAYVGLYLQEEIQAESLTRSISNFTRFLETAALTNGEQVIFTEVANDAQIPARTVRDHYQILEDTLVGVLLPAFRSTIKRKAMASAKFYFFDVGVGNALLNRWSLKPGTPEYGRALEHYIFCELRAAIDYLRSDAKLSYWRSTSLLEVDFVADAGSAKRVGIEVKGTGLVSKKDLRGLLALEEDLPGIRKIVVSLEHALRTTKEGVEIFPVEEFLKALWRGEIL